MDNRTFIMGIALLREREVTLLDSHGHDLTNNADEMQELMMLMMAAFATVEKKRLVKKLRAARERKRATGVKVEGRKCIHEVAPEAVLLAKRLRRASP